MQSAFDPLRLVAQLHPKLDKGRLNSAVYALVISRLDYCKALHMGIPLEMVRKLQLWQNSAVRLLTGARQFEYITPLLARPHWLPISFQAQIRVLVLTYKSLYGSGPQ